MHEYCPHQTGMLKQSLQDFNTNAAVYIYIYICSNDAETSTFDLRTSLTPRLAQFQGVGDPRDAQRRVVAIRVRVNQHVPRVGKIRPAQTPRRRGLSAQPPPWCIGTPH